MRHSSKAKTRERERVTARKRGRQRKESVYRKYIHFLLIGMVRLVWYGLLCASGKIYEIKFFLKSILFPVNKMNQSC